MSQGSQQAKDGLPVGGASNAFAILIFRNIWFSRVNLFFERSKRCSNERICSKEGSIEWATQKSAQERRGEEVLKRGKRAQLSEPLKKLQREESRKKQEGLL